MRGHRTAGGGKVLVPLVAILMLLTACGGTMKGSVRASANASPTPFQPGAGGIGLDDRSASGPISITFTPPPTAYISPLALATPVAFDPPLLETGRAMPSHLTNPLTGLPPFSPDMLERRPMAVKITNYPRYVRPQSGLSRADVVFEYYIEDRLTRFIALIYGNDSARVGPVRSGRYFDEHVTRMYHAYFVFKYADPREYTYFKESDLLENLIVPGNGSCPPFVVGESRRDTYNNIFFNSTRFAACLEKAGLDNSRPALRSSFFSDEPLHLASEAARVYSRYSADDYNYWEYDPRTGHYLRYQETADTRAGKPEVYAPLTDAQTGKTISAANVVVLFVRHRFANVYDEEDEVYQIDLVDSGPAFVFRDGGAIPAYWYRSDLDQPLVLATESGAPVYLRPGVTFFQIIGLSSTYAQADGVWRFRFQTP